jgi:hypothetical protein
MISLPTVADDLDVDVIVVIVVSPDVFGTGITRVRKAHAR